MTERDVAVAARGLRLPRETLCGAVTLVLPLLDALAAGGAWWKRWVLRSLVTALREWQEGYCAKAPDFVEPQA